MSSSILTGLDDSLPLASQDAADMLMCKHAADALDRHYPGHLWAVHADGGMLNIRNLMLSAEWGYRIRVPTVYSASDMQHRVIFAGGEILERFQLARGRFSEDQYVGLKTRFDGTPEGQL